MTRFLDILVWITVQNDVLLQIRLSSYSHQCQEEEEDAKPLTPWTVNHQPIKQNKNALLRVGYMFRVAHEATTTFQPKTGALEVFLAPKKPPASV